MKLLTEISHAMDQWVVDEVAAAQNEGSKAMRETRIHDKFDHAVGA
jgi:hypothetical protein